MGDIGAVLLEFLGNVESSLPAVFYIFKDARIAIGLALLLFVIAMLSLLYIWFVRISPMVSKLEDLADRFSSFENPTEFMQHFDKADELLSESGTTRYGWNEFKKRLIFPESGNTDQPLRATTSPAAFINSRYVEGRKVNLKFYESFADYFVGVGLILTFIGLVSALYFAALGLQSGSPEEARSSLTALLSAATFKFITSIAGISSSIIFSIVFHKMSDALNEAYMGLSDVLVDNIYFASQESIGFGQYRELRKQSDFLSGIESNLVRQ